jgi:pimeloyl-ACP methyl ester carboxylesterase
MSRRSDRKAPMRRTALIKAAALGAAGVAGGLVAFTAWSARDAQRRVPPDGTFLDVDGARLHYVDMGSGPAIVLVHGLGGQLRNFTHSLTERLLRDHRVVVVDRPGSGYSTFVGTGGRGLHAQAAIIGRLITALKLDRPLLVGHSLGGAIALGVATQDGPPLGALALISPLTQPVDDVPAAFAALKKPSAVARALIAWTLAVPVGKLSRAATLAMIFGPDPVPADFGERGGGLLGTRPSAFFAASREVTEGGDELADVAADYGRITVPVGILFGRGDLILSPELHGGRTAAEIPGAELRLIDGGHMIPITAPDTVAAWIREQAARIR